MSKKSARKHRTQRSQGRRSRTKEPRRLSTARPPDGLDICYLCGLEIDPADRTVDHVPAKQIFPASIRGAYNLDQLITLPSHHACNNGYSLDEQYTVWTLGSVSHGSDTGRALIEDHARSLRAGKNALLAKKILQQFQERPSGIILPPGMVALKFEANRIMRVMWKITRGLFRHETGRLLPDGTAFKVDLVEPAVAGARAVNLLHDRVKAERSRGTYGRLFDYKYVDLQEGDKRLHAWGFLLWDQFMVFVYHHDPDAPPTAPTTGP